MLPIDIINKRRIPIHDILPPLTTNHESISNNSPLGFIVKSHHFSQIMNETSQMEPVIFRIIFPYPLSSLEGMDYVGNIDIWITFIHQFVKFFQSVPDVGFEMGETQPRLHFITDEFHGLIRVHVQISFPDSLFDRVIFVDGVVSELSDWLLGKSWFGSQKFGRIDHLNFVVVLKKI